MDMKLWIVLAVHCLSLVFCKKDCELTPKRTFEVETGAALSVRAEINEFRGFVIDINYEERTNCRIKLSPARSLMYMHNGTAYYKTELGSIVAEGWQDFDIFVGNNTLKVTCITSKKAPLEFDVYAEIKSITVSSTNLKICEESCYTEKSVEKNIENEEKFKMTAFTTSNHPITFKISSYDKDEPTSLLEIKPNDCKHGNKRVPCGYIQQGWNTLEIFANKNSLTINNNIIPVDVSLRSLSITGDYLVNCTKGSPTWKISKEEIPIPIYAGQDISFTLTSTVEFSPVFNLDGNEWTLYWNHGMFIKFGSSGKPMKPNVHKIIFEVSSEKLILYNEDKTDVLMVRKMEKTPEVLLVRSTKGEFKLALFLEEPSPQLTETTPVQENLPENRTSIENGECPSFIVWQITSVLFAVVAAALSYVIYYYHSRTKKDIHPMESEMEEGAALLAKEENNHLSPLKEHIKSTWTKQYGHTNPHLIPHFKDVCKIEMKSNKKKDSKKILGELDPKKSKKVILVVGETGSGKSSFINGMTNFIYGVKYEDTFRFKLVDDMDDCNSSGTNNTEEITAYVIPFMPGIKDDCNYIFIDTPGFGDARGIEEDTKWNHKFFKFLKENPDINEVDGICFVIKESDTRLSRAHRYIIDGLFSMFGKDIKNNIFVVSSHSDGLTTNVPKLLQGSGVNYDIAIQFSSNGLYNDTEFESESSEYINDYFEKFWNLTMDQMKPFFDHLIRKSPVSLSLTNIVLEENKDIDKLKDELLELNAIENNATDQDRDDIQSKIEQNQELLMTKLDEAQKLYGRLKTIPCKENPLAINDYIDILITDEDDPNKKLELKKLKDRNTVFHKLLENKKPSNRLVKILFGEKTEKTE